MSTWLKIPPGAKKARVEIPQSEESKTPLVLLSSVAAKARAETPDADEYPSLIPASIPLPPVPGAQGFETLIDFNHLKSMADPARFIAAVKSKLKNGVIQMRCVRSAQLTTSGAGALSLFTVCDMQQFDEASQLNSLFAQARSVASQVTFTPLLPLSTTNAWTMAVAYEPSAIVGTSVKSYTAITRLASCRLFSPVYTTPFKVAYRITAKPWSQITAASAGIEPIGGQSGGWFYTISGVAPNTTVIAAYLIEQIFELRIKQ